MRVNVRMVYWYAVASKCLVSKEKVNLADLFRNFDSDILKVIAASLEDRVFFSKIIDLKPIAKWQERGMCLIGDTVHTMTANIGKVDYQVIEDAYTVGQLLDSDKSMERIGGI